GVLKISELARPHQTIAGRKLYVLGDALLRLFDRSAEIAPPDAELHGDKTLHAFVVNPGRARVERDGGEFADRDVGIGAARACVSHFDVTNFVNVAAVFRRVAEDEIEL